jgi:putative MATE family efflux protein
LPPESQRTIAARLFRLAAPIIGINVLSVLTLAVDTAMCGRLENSDTVLKALGFAAQLVFLLMVAMMGLVVGTVALVARAYGAKQHDRVSHLLAQSTQLTVIVGVSIAIVGNIFAPSLLRLLGASDDVVEQGLEYLRPMLTGAVFYYLTIHYGGVLRGVGNTRLPFLVALLANAVNVALDYAFILGNWGFPAMGVSGAAYATVISYAINVAVMVIVLRRGVVPGLGAPLRPQPLDRPLARELYRIGAPAALDMLILNVAFLSIIGMLGRIDELAVAAHGIGLRIQALAFVPGLGISQATGALVGQALGAGDPHQARQIARASMLLCTVIMTGLGAAIIGSAYPIVAVFDVASNTRLEMLSVQWMFLLGYCMPPVGVHIALVGVLQGAGATNTTLAINFFSTVLIQVPLSYVLGFTFDLGSFGVWLSFPLSFIIKAALDYIAYRRGTWARTGVTV